MNMKRIISGALALALCLCLALPCAPRAQALSFTDISDSETAQNVEVLRMLGVIDGTGNGRFQPNGTLSRAQFCKMAVVMLGKKGAVGQYQTYTVFPDVRASHWAAGYVNLAVKSEEKLIAGYPDGKFHPDDQITFGQTVTILMRMLGYQDSDVGAVWPQGYLNAASAIGLTEGVQLGANAKLTRAQAAKLFCKLLTTERKEGGAYAAKLGTLVSDVVLLNVNATAEDGSKNAIQTQEDKTYKVADRAADASLAGSKGTLLLNSSGRVLTFLPDRSTKQTITVSEAKANALVDMNGKKYTVHSSTVSYYRGEQKSYSDIFFDLNGATVTLYFDAAGKLDYLFAGAARADDAVIVSGQGSTLGFERLTDSTNYAIYKNGTLATAADLRQYDVATYDASTNTIRVSDTRLTGYYSNVEPNLESPTKVTVMNHEFSVLPGAADSLSSFKIGQQVTLLLTEDNQVAGAVDPSKARGNAVGIATSVSTDSVTVKLFCGLEIKGNPHLSSSSVGQYDGQLVRVTSYQKGDQISLGRVTSGTVRGDFDVAGRKVGDKPLAGNVRIYDKVGNSPLVSVKLSDITQAKISAGSVLYAEADYAGRVSVIVLNNGTGEAYTYGRYRFTPSSGKDDSYTNATISVEYGNGKTTDTVECGDGYRDGEFGGLALSTGSTGAKRVAGTAQVTKLEKVSNSAWNGNTSVTVKGTTYVVPDSVVCYNKTTGYWCSLSAARAFSGAADLYYDSIGNKIRIVVVG
mgnify:CR=1 FL=1